MTIETGGPAFPYHETGDCGVRPGMTLRDYFAAKAMEAMIGGSLRGGLFKLVSKIAASLGLDSDHYIAKKAYEQADAMLEARKS